jgi:hypothetical protein
MFPGDTLNASILTVTNGDSLDPIVSLRSSETIGIVKQDLENNSQPKHRSLLSDFWTPIAVFFAMGAYTAGLIVTRKRGEVAGILSGGRSLPEREDIIGIISIMTGFPDLIKNFVYDRRIISFINFSDLIVYKGLNAEPANRAICIKALKALAISPWIHTQSQESVENNVKLLDPSFTDEELEELRTIRSAIKTNADFRKEMKVLFDSA